MLSIALRIPAEFDARARWTLGVLGTRWGLPLRFVSSVRDAHVVYGGAPHDAGTAVPLPFDPAAYDGAGVGRAVVEPDGLRWIAPGVADPAHADLVGGAYRLLALLDEGAVPEVERDARGIFRVAALPPTRREVLDQPLVETQAGALLERVLARHPGLAAARRPRWPGGAKWAIALSHDVDAARLGAPVEIFTQIAKALLRGSRDHLRLAGLGLSALARPDRDPWFAFDAWRAWEEARGMRSAFYVFHRAAGTPRDLNDCKSGLGDVPGGWPLLRRMAAEGWEFGLHPSIHSKDTPGAFAASKLWLEERLGRPVAGLRHHYWAIDWRRPARTLREHARAGFRYDSSMAWRDREGYRAGTALPYAPFDPESDRPLDLLELPCNLMDGHVLLADPRGRRRETASALERGRRIIERTREVGGVLTPDWHQETAFNRLHVRGYLEALGALLGPRPAERDAWCATPGEIVEYWRTYSDGLLREARG